jgi:flagellar hook assembly protein FlgD
VIESPSGVGENPTDAGPRMESVRVAPNPSQGPTAILWESIEPAPLRLEIYDAAGRQVRRLRLPASGAGPQRVLWDGRDDAGASVRPGVYWVRVPGGPATSVSKLVIVE